MQEYNHKDIEKKWQKKWAEDNVYKTSDDSQKEKYYVLDMFPYPSGAGLHVGHPKGYIATDIYSRFKKAQGYNVLHPMGWDAFGLPAENYAIKNKIQPQKAVDENVKKFKDQLEHIGFSYDWEREINTTDPKYYKWTQWAFLQMFKKGLAYESNEPINWCPSCKTGLANEDLNADGTCERCDSVVEKKPIRQWVLKITDYADRLLEDLESLDKWPESIKESQRNWIGRSEGLEVKFMIKDSKEHIPVYTTRIDTIYSGTFIILAPEHPYIDKYKDIITNYDDVVEYRKEVSKIDNIERTKLEKEKTGVQLESLTVINPATGEEMPVWTSDFVLYGYGTGAVFADAHDKRDFNLAKKYDIPLKVSLIPEDESINRKVIENLEECFEGEGVLINSREFDGLTSKEARIKIAEKLQKDNLATPAVNYRLQDWVFSRQRYWGEPIPLIHCEKCGVVPVPEKDLPVTLPDVESYEPTGTGESPLAGIDDWVNVKCPECGGDGKRETNTMPQWAGSCWYYLRYIDPDNENALVDKEKEKYWQPVDLYVGGAEHATRHLIYARFWHKFLYDIGIVSDVEPFIKLKSVGLILAEDGRKMSKRWGNVINPDDVIEKLGADTLRVYEMFMGPFESAISWSTDNMVGSRRFLERVWKLQDKVSDNDSENDSDLEKAMHKTIKKITSDIENFSHNTAISQLMILLNEIDKKGSISKDVLKNYIILLAPFAPHISQEIWTNIGESGYIYNQQWLDFDEDKTIDDVITIAVQINGKVRGQIDIKSDQTEPEVIENAKKNDNIKKYLEAVEIKKVIYIKNKIINIVV